MFGKLVVSWVGVESYSTSTLTIPLAETIVGTLGLYVATKKK
ncbi:hypothetical protein [Periweissella cryptocerci]|nr:hypothetical protein [Periweissella cryptocerci]